MIDHQPLGKRKRSEGSLLRVKKPRQPVASCWLESAAARRREGWIMETKRSIRQKENGDARRSEESTDK